MSKAVLISIRPKWCELILSGKKTVEIRKKMMKTPIRCYIYCTKPRYEHEDFFVMNDGTEDCYFFYGGGKVIGEFVCDWVEPIHVYEDGAVQNWMYAEASRSGLTYEEVAEYIGRGKTGYALHISELKVYDTPKLLTDFVKADSPSFDDVSDCLCPYCEETEYGEKAMYVTPAGNPIMCEGVYCNNAYQAFLDYEGYTITRPPQSWCYVEELEVIDEKTDG